MACRGREGSAPGRLPQARTEDRVAMACREREGSGRLPQAQTEDLVAMACRDRVGVGWLPHGRSHWKLPILFVKI